MNDRDQGGRDHDDHGHGDRRGPPGTQFLQLELSRVVAAEAEQMATDAARAIVAEAIRERVEERLGERLRGIGRVVADAFADDVEANLRIEEEIAKRMEARKPLEESVREAFRGKKG